MKHQKNEADLNLNSGIRPDELILIRGSKWFYQNRELTKAEIDNLKSEAELIQNTSLWKILIKEGLYHCQKRAIMDVKDYEGLTRVQEFHKVVVLFAEFIQKIIKS